MRCNPEQIHTTATRIQDLANSFWDDVETLRRDAEPLMRAEWTGDAADTEQILALVGRAKQIGARITEPNTRPCTAR